MLVYYGSMHINDILIYCNNTLTCSAFFKKKKKQLTCDLYSSPFQFCNQRAVAKGAIVVKEPWEESDDSGTVKMAMIKTYGDTTHTLIDRSGYKGLFLPGYRASTFKDPLVELLCVQCILIKKFSMLYWFTGL